LIIGARDPDRIKLEITHFWGRPLFYILITETTLQILSFPEKRYYLADVREPLPPTFLPVHLDTDQLWALGRGFPLLSRHHHAVSDRGNQISLLNGKGNIVQLINIYPENHLPFQVFFPGQGLRLSFSGFEDDNSIQYAKKTQLHDQEHEIMLELILKQTAFNKTFDKSIFELTPPPDFECIQGNPILDTQ